MLIIPECAVNKILTETLKILCSLLPSSHHVESTLRSEAETWINDLASTTKLSVPNFGIISASKSLS